MWGPIHDTYTPRPQGKYPRPLVSIEGPLAERLDVLSTTGRALRPLVAIGLASRAVDHHIEVSDDHWSRQYDQYRPVVVQIRPVVAKGHVMRPVVETLGRGGPYKRPVVLYLQPVVVIRPVVMFSRPLVYVISTSA